MSQDKPTNENATNTIKLVVALFEKWELSENEQQRIFEKACKSSDLLAASCAMSLDDLERASYLLSIHACLRNLYPQNLEMRFQWIKMNNQFFENRTPLSVIMEEGIAGLKAVHHNLELMLNN